MSAKELLMILLVAGSVICFVIVLIWYRPAKKPKTNPLVDQLEQKLQQKEDAQ